MDRKERALVGRLARFGLHSLGWMEIHNLLNSEEQLLTNLTSRAHPRLILLLNPQMFEARQRVCLNMKGLVAWGYRPGRLLLHALGLWHHVYSVRCVCVPILRLSILVVLISGLIHFKDTAATLVPSIHHLGLRLLLLSPWIIVYRLSRRHHGVRWLLHWLPSFVVRLLIHHVRHHNWRVRRGSPWISLELLLLLLHMRRHHTSSVSRIVHSILIARGLRRVLSRLHHMILVHYRARREVWIAIVVGGPAVALLLRDSSHSCHCIQLIILVLFLVSMCRIIIIWILHADRCHLIPLALRLPTTIHVLWLVYLLLIKDLGGHRYLSLPLPSLHFGWVELLFRLLHSIVPLVSTKLLSLIGILNDSLYKIILWRWRLRLKLGCIQVHWCE